MADDTGSTDPNLTPSVRPADVDHPPTSPDILAKDNDAPQLDKKNDFENENPKGPFAVKKRPNRLRRSLSQTSNTNEPKSEAPTAVEPRASQNNEYPQSPKTDWDEKLHDPDEAQKQSINLKQLVDPVTLKDIASHRKSLNIAFQFRTPQNTTSTQNAVDSDSANDVKTATSINQPQAQQAQQEQQATKPMITPSAIMDAKADMQTLARQLHDLNIQMQQLHTAPQTRVTCRVKPIYELKPCDAKRTVSVQDSGISIDSRSKVSDISGRMPLVHKGGSKPQQGTERKKHHRPDRPDVKPAAITRELVRKHLLISRTNVDDFEEENIRYPDECTMRTMQIVAKLKVDLGKDGDVEKLLQANNIQGAWDKLNEHNQILDKLWGTGQESLVDIAEGLKPKGLYARQPRRQGRLGSPSARSPTKDSPANAKKKEPTTNSIITMSESQTSGSQSMPSNSMSSQQSSGVDSKSGSFSSPLPKGGARPKERKRRSAERQIRSKNKKSRSKSGRSRSRVGNGRPKDVNKDGKSDRDSTKRSSKDRPRGANSRKKRSTGDSKSKRAGKGRARVASKQRGTGANTSRKRSGSRSRSLSPRPLDAPTRKEHWERATKSYRSPSSASEDLSMRKDQKPQKTDCCIMM